MKKEKKDVVLIGAGIMSATLAVLMKRLNPEFNITIYEMLDNIAEESTSALNNAGTGHSGFCELNYTPRKLDGSIDIHKAIDIAGQFMISKDFWASLVKEGYLNDPKSFIQKTPHYSFVNKEEDIKFLKERYFLLKEHPFFSGMEYSEDHEVISKWIPLVMKGRNKNEKIACTRVESGTDVNFEAITKQMIDSLIKKDQVKLHCAHMVKDLRKRKNGRWKLDIKDLKNNKSIIDEADFVFLGAGGGSILLLEKSGIPESKGYGGFPVGGEWLICHNEKVVQQHQAKVYGQAPNGSPPMSVPHLDTRIIDGQQKLLFGPFAVFSTKFLKKGSHMDLFKSLQVKNMGFMTQAGMKNIDLTKYLLEQLSLFKEDKMEVLRNYLPYAESKDWEEESAGQRVQIIKKLKNQGGVLEFGTEVVNSSDGSMVALLGASPGASTSVHVMINVLKQCFDDYNSSEWKEKLHEMIPCLDGIFDEEMIKESIARTNKELKL